MPGDLDWLSAHGYARYHQAPDAETWICRDFSARHDTRVWAELVVTTTGELEPSEFLKVYAALPDENLCHVIAEIDNVRPDDLQSRLAWYEARVLAMLELGLGVNPGARPTPRETNPPCPSCGAELRTSLAQQCFKCGADWHPRPAGDL